MKALLFINGDSDNIQVFLVNLMNYMMHVQGWKLTLARSPEAS